MEKRALPIRIEEELGDTRALIIDNDFPFLTDALTEKLLLRGCEVDKNPTAERRYDYVISLGISKKLQKILKKNPRVFPFQKLMKNGGKALIVISSAHEVSKESEKSIPTLTLDTSKTFSASSLADKILNKLFTGRPQRIREEPKRQIEFEDDEEVKESKKGNKRLNTRLLLVIVSLLLFFSPILIFASTATAGAYLLSRAADTEISVAKREVYARYAGYSTNLTQKSGSFLQAIIFPFSKQKAEEIQAISDISVQVSSSAIDALEIEKRAREDIARIFKQGDIDNFENNIPFYREKLDRIGSSLSESSESLEKIVFLKKIPGISSYWPATTKIEEARKYAQEAREIIDIVPEVFAFDGEKTYLLLFQNNFELRPTGGFIGSFALMNIKNGTVTAIDVEDIYEADGQLTGRVEPPLPIKTYLNQPNWFLRDSNWHPDFRESAKQAEWFLQKEIGKNVDGVIAVDLYFVKDLLRSLDGVYVPDYKARVTADDFFVKLQSDTHEDFFPGSSKKKSLLSSLLTALTIEMKDRSNLPFGKIMATMATSLTGKHMLLYFHDALSQKTVEHLGWGGRLLSPGMTTSAAIPVVLDYQQVLDSNLGVNKANYYVEREFVNEVDATNTTLNRKTTVYYKNKSPLKTTLFGGDYKNFVRVLIPKDSKIISIKVADKELQLNSDTIQEPYQDKIAYGFLAEVPAGSEKKIIINYSLPIPATKKFSYYLIIQKQPGTDRDPFIFKTTNSPNWIITTSTIPTLPYLNDLSVDRLLSLDFTSTIE
jgi:hypothetical protein